MLSDITQTIATIDTQAGVDTLFNFSSSLRLGDILDAMVFSIDSQDRDRDLSTGAAIGIEVYACNRRPATVAEARAGTPIVNFAANMTPLISLGTGSPVDPYKGSFQYRFNMPLNFVPEPQARNLVLVLETGVNSMGAVFAKVFRRREAGE